MYARIVSDVAVDVAADPHMMFHPHLAAEFVAVPADVQPGWRLVDGAWRAPAPEPEPPPHDLDALKAQLVAQIDIDAEAQRALYITPGSGQAMEYQQAAVEAGALLAALAADPAHEPTPGAYPMLEASVGIDGDTLADVAATVAAMHAQWQAIGSAIRGARLAAKAAVLAAEDEAAARAAAVVAWPGVAA